MKATNKVNEAKMSSSNGGMQPKICVSFINEPHHICEMCLRFVFIQTNCTLSEKMRHKKTGKNYKYASAIIKRVSCFMNENINFNFFHIIPYSHYVTYFEFYHDATLIPHPLHFIFSTLQGLLWTLQNW